MQETEFSPAVRFTSWQPQGLPLRVRYHQAYNTMAFASMSENMPNA